MYTAQSLAQETEAGGLESPKYDRNAFCIGTFCRKKQ